MVLALLILAALPFWPYFELNSLALGRSGRSNISASFLWEVFNIIQLTSTDDCWYYMYILSFALSQTWKWLTLWMLHWLASKLEHPDNALKKLHHRSALYMCIAEEIILVDSFAWFYMPIRNSKSLPCNQSFHGGSDKPMSC